MKTKKVRKQRAIHKTYYKRICQNCEQIVEIYMRLQPIKRDFLRSDLTDCPTCQSTQLITKTIDRIEYTHIHQQWDLLDQGEPVDEETEMEGMIPVLDLSEFCE
jgi:hypothetical protein